MVDVRQITLRPDFSDVPRTAPGRTPDVRIPEHGMQPLPHPMPKPMPLPVDPPRVGDPEPVDPSLQEAVEDYADGISDTLDDYMERQDLGDESLQSREYKQLMELVASLEQTLQQYIQADQEDMKSFIFTMRLILDPRHGFMSDRQRAEQRGNEIIEGALRAMQQARETIEQRVIIHMQVPEELDETSKIWSDTAEQYRQAGERLPALRAVVGWTGQAAHEYKTMANLQQKASDELMPLPRVLSDAYKVIATLNRAVLIAVYAELDAVAKRISSIASAGPGRLYARVAHFKSQMELFNLLMLPQALDVSGDGIDNIGRIIADVRGAVNVLSQDWPSGTGRAGLTAGDTSAPSLRNHC